MENMLSSAPLPSSLPDRFILLPDQRPPASSVAVSLPVIDLSRGRDEVRRAVLDAGRELGFFQVINHGVSEQTMREMEEVCEEFFRLPAADKTALYSEDRFKRNRLFSGTIYGDRYWRDCLRLACAFPVGDTKNDWPDKPQSLREVIEKFIMPTRGVAMELLRLLSEGMGLRPDYFEGDLSGGDVVIHVNHYPPCPDPSLTLSLPPHCDRNLITLLLPGTVNGLQVVYKGEWINVDPVPNSFIVNFGRQLEIITNGMLKSIEHRAVANSALARTSVAAFIMPAADSLIGPAEEFVSKDNPPRYRPAIFGEFIR
ncbi:2'-deoxymugineic-acid 2'-dioxygenase-like [Triticum dicoccoides]|uniref:2'-deoxymugineic-acid 2'-dioxygenase-like n=1 Tax=Triticum dicoccoides TaxID=85692 RepID=UPI000E7C1F40|nr:2'-deoxymugineic-acid 2'-dioxygenase-like [Triticum dicoccoides]